MKKILVIGSNSFSGSNFISYAIENEFQVTGISRSKEKMRLCFLINGEIVKILNSFN